MTNETRFKTTLAVFVLLATFMTQSSSVVAQSQTGQAVATPGVVEPPVPIKQPVSAQSAASVPQASKGEQVLWGGVSLASYAETPEEQLKAMPVIGSLLMCSKSPEGCGGVDVNAVAKDAIAKAKFKDFTVAIGTVSTNQLQGFIITPVITNESVVEAFEGKSFGYSYTHRIFGNLMIMQFLPGEVKYVAAYPFILKRFDIQLQKLSKAQQNKVFLDLYLGGNLGANYFQELYKSASERLSLNEREHNYVQINDVKLSPDVEKVLTKTYGAKSWKQQIANFFEANLAIETNSPILPSSVGQQTTKQMLVVFRDASAKLTIPPAGYTVGIGVNRFLRHEAKDGKVVCFMVAANVTVTDPYGDQIADLKFARRQDSCGVTLPGTVRPDTMYFPESMFSLLNGVAKQFGGVVDSKFIKNNVEKPAGVDKKIRNLSKTMFNQ